MKPKDHIHNQNEEYPQNLKVFSLTYEVIDEIANRITRIEAAAFGIQDHETMAALDRINAEHVSEKIIDLVNFTIENYRKHGKR